MASQEQGRAESLARFAEIRTVEAAAEVRFAQERADMEVARRRAEQEQTLNEGKLQQVASLYTAEAAVQEANRRARTAE